MIARCDIKRARDHLASLQRQKEASAGPCSTCRFGSKGTYSFERLCWHPLFVEGKFNPVTGKVRWRDVGQDDMRRNGGLCGPSGQLYERAAIHVRIWRRVPAEALAFMASILVAIVFVTIAVCAAP